MNEKTPFERLMHWWEMTDEEMEKHYLSRSYRRERTVGASVSVVIEHEERIKQLEAKLGGVDQSASSREARMEVLLVEAAGEMHKECADCAARPGAAVLCLSCQQKRLLACRIDKCLRGKWED